MAITTVWIKEFDEAGKDECEVEFEGYPKVVDNGIGKYEFWGSIGYDSQLSVECEEVTWDETLYTKEENEIIEKYEEEAAEELCKNFEPPEPDYDERD
jgi:hypothetical protein